jgi:hypothetical protein
MEHNRKHKSIMTHRCIHNETLAGVQYVAVRCQTMRTYSNDIELQERDVHAPSVSSSCKCVTRISPTRLHRFSSPGRRESTPEKNPVTTSYHKCVLRGITLAHTTRREQQTNCGRRPNQRPKANEFLLKRLTAVRFDVW